MWTYEQSVMCLSTPSQNRYIRYPVRRSEHACAFWLGSKIHVNAFEPCLNRPAYESGLHGNEVTA